MRVVLDTNVLVYAEGVNSPTKRIEALRLVELLPVRSTILPVQVLAELFNVLVRKGGYSRTAARQSVLAWDDSFTVAETSVASLLAAVDLAANHQLTVWDALVLAVAADSGCRIVLSEDLQEGFTWNGVTVVNPFLPTWHPLLEIAIGGFPPR